MRAIGDRDLKVYGIFGIPLGHTLSPAIQNRAFDHYGLKSVYLAFERSPDRFRYLMCHLKSLLLEGFNVTVPFKEIVIPYLDRLSPEARAIGAVNTVKRVGSNWVGYNTDFDGFNAGLREARFNAKSKCAVVLGAGGAARTAVFSLAKKGARSIVIANRTEARARRLVRKFGPFFPKTSVTCVGLSGKLFQHALSEADLVVNATEVGLNKRDPLLVANRHYPSKKILVYDLIYQPHRTKLLKSAKRLGHKIQNGEVMLLHQGAKAFEIWTGRRAPVQPMKKAFHAALGD